jgi:hypothetical protein
VAQGEGLVQTPIPQKKKKKKKKKRVFKEIIALYSSNLMKEETGLSPNQVNTKKSMPRYIIIKLLKTKDKEKNLETSQREMKP